DGVRPSPMRPLLPQEKPEYPVPDRETKHDANRQRCQNIVCQSQLSHPVGLHAWAMVDLQLLFGSTRSWYPRALDVKIGYQVVEKDLRSARPSVHLPQQ